MPTETRSNDIDETEDGDAGGYSVQVGARLRSIRRQKRLSLQDVEANSGEEFKASVLGAYERGERSISVPRLKRLAEFYNVPVDQLLPQDLRMVYSDESARAAQVEAVRIDLRAIERQEVAETETLKRYLTMIQVQRQDFNGRVLTIRRDDVRAIAAILGVPVDTAVEHLTALGIAKRV